MNTEYTINNQYSTPLKTIYSTLHNPKALNKIRIHKIIDNRYIYTLALMGGRGSPGVYRVL